MYPVCLEVGSSWKCQAGVRLQCRSMPRVSIHQQGAMIVGATTPRMTVINVGEINHGISRPGGSGGASCDHCPLQRDAPPEDL